MAANWPVVLTSKGSGGDGLWERNLAHSDEKSNNKESYMMMLCIAFATLLTSIWPWQQQQVSQPKGGLITLYAQDVLARTLCFDDGDYGLIFQDNMVKNRCSHLEFDHYTKGNFSLGFHGEQTAIVDLGTSEELQQRYGYAEAGRGNGFASIRLIDGKFVILRDYKVQSTQELKEGSHLFEEKRRGLQTIRIQSGHIYLARVFDQGRSPFQRIVKIMVVAYTPSESVTIRWQLL